MHNDKKENNLPKKIGEYLACDEKTIAQGLVYYRQRQFSKALKYFNRGKTHDAPSRTFLERCSHLLENPPPKDWNGVWISEHK